MKKVVEKDFFKHVLCQRKKVLGLCSTFSSVSETFFCPIKNFWHFLREERISKLTQALTTIKLTVWTSVVFSFATFVIILDSKSFKKTPTLFVRGHPGWISIISWTFIPEKEFLLRLYICEGKKSLQSRFFVLFHFNTGRADFLKGKPVEPLGRKSADPTAKPQLRLFPHMSGLPCWFFYPCRSRSSVPEKRSLRTH